MIAYLVRRHLARLDPTWIGLLVVGVLAAMSFGGASMTVLAVVVILSWRNTPWRDEAGFECSLPIRGREVVMARALATLVPGLLVAAVWIAAWRLRDPDAFPLTTMLDVAALVALVPLLPHAVTRGVPRANAELLTFLAWAAVAALGAGAMRVLPPAMTTSLSALAIVAVLAVIWTGVPDALPAAPAPPATSSAASTDGGSPTPPTELDWPWAVARATVPLRAVMFYLVLFVGAMVGDPLPFFGLAVLAIPPMIRQRTRWLATMPLSHRARLLAMVVPGVVASAGCVAIGAVERGTSATLGTWLVSGAALLTIGLSLMLLSALGRRWTRRRAPMMGEALAALPVIAFVVADAGLEMRRGVGIKPMLYGVARGIGAAIPEHVWLALVIAAVPLAMYALLEAEFRRSEPALVTRPPGR